jgi:hypothetical protein
VTLRRSDLSRLLFEKVKDTTEIIFSNAIVDLQEHADSVQVQFKSGIYRRFDFVIGADAPQPPKVFPWRSTSEYLTGNFVGYTDFISNR